ncbi:MULTISPECIES: hypothetical protein [unclassified Luteimonas]
MCQSWKLDANLSVVLHRSDDFSQWQMQRQPRQLSPFTLHVEIHGVVVSQIDIERMVADPTRAESLDACRDATYKMHLPLSGSERVTARRP